MSAQAERAANAIVEPTGASPARRPAIVAVDDEPPVLAAVARDLRRGFGERFRVLRAGSGAEPTACPANTSLGHAPGPNAPAGGGEIPSALVTTAVR